MGRNSKVLFRDPVSKNYFARWYEGEKKSGCHLTLPMRPGHIKDFQS